jgi:hypothetical protein
VKCPHCQHEITLDTPRAGACLGAVRNLFDEGPEWTVDEIIARVDAPKKRIYNALGYLARRRLVTHVSYGKYRWNGAHP